MPNRNGVPFDLKRAEVRTRKTDYYDLILRKILLRQGTNGSSRHHFCLLKARRDDNNVDVLWSGDRMRRVDPRCCGLCVGMDALNDYRLIVFNN